MYILKLKDIILTFGGGLSAICREIFAPILFSPPFVFVQFKTCRIQNIFYQEITVLIQYSIHFKLYKGYFKTRWNH